MGHRANYVLLSRFGWTLYYSHWGAVSIDRDLAYGPAHAVRFVQAQEEVSEWIGRAWAEGGALIDLVGRRLRFFGRNELPELAYRRAFLDHLAGTWPGWTVRWAYNELSDFTAVVGVDRTVLDLPEPETEPDIPLLSEAGSRDCWALLTVCEPTGRGVAACLDPFAGRHWAPWMGPAVLARLPKLGQAPDPAGTTPDWGVHIDRERRRMGWWTAASDRNLHRVASRWPGWHVEFWEDRYEQHLAACDGRIPCPAVDIEDGRRRLRERLDAPGTDPVPGILEMIDKRRAEGEDVEVLAPITSHTHVDPPDRCPDVR